MTAPWWLAGGWALDVFLGEQTRPHSDVDVVVLRRDMPCVLSQLAGWELRTGLGDGVLDLSPLAGPFPSDREVLWCRPGGAAEWAFELLVSPAEGDEWVFKRDPRVRRPLASLGTGVLPPEVVLLFKAKALREKDEVDFARVLPALSGSAKEWLVLC